MMNTIGILEKLVQNSYMYKGVILQLSKFEGCLCNMNLFIETHDLEFHKSPLSSVSNL